MKKSNLLQMLLVIIITAFLAVPLTASQRMGQGKGMPKYDPASEMTIKGIVEEVKEQTCPVCRMGQMGTHLMIRTDKETIEVHVDPSSFVAEKNFAFAKGDQIEVIGSKMKMANNDVLLAREIKKGDQILTLRDARGIPAWSRGKRKRG